MTWANSKDLYSELCKQVVIKNLKIALLHGKDLYSELCKQVVIKNLKIALLHGNEPDNS